MNKEKLISALQELESSFKEVQEAWNEVEGFEDGTDFYPFDDSFEYIVSKVMAWRDKFSKELKSTPEDEEYYLCKCNRCNTLFYDENPRSADEKTKIKDLIALPFHMTLLTINEETFWGCPNCETDGYLSDDVTHFLRGGNFLWIKKEIACID